MSRYGVDWFAVRDGDRLLGWAWDHELGGDPSAAPLKEFEGRIDASASLREALDTVITSHTKIAAVMDGDAFLGMVTIDEISQEILE